MDFVKQNVCEEENTQMGGTYCVHLVDAQLRLKSVGALLEKFAQTNDAALLDDVERTLKNTMDALGEEGFKILSVKKSIHADVDSVTNYPVFKRMLNENMETIKFSGENPLKPTLVVVNEQTKEMLVVDERDFSSHIFCCNNKMFKQP